LEEGSQGLLEGRNRMGKPPPPPKKNTLASEEKFNEILWADKYINSLILISETYNQNLKLTKMQQD
jgi:hypothetical protein